MYRYAARTAAGELVRGSVEAASSEAVLAGLRSRALFVTGVQREHGAAQMLRRSLHLGAPSRRALHAFFRSFATLVRAGVPLRRALDICSERAGDGALGEALRAVTSDVERGTTIGDALARRPRVFGDLHVAMVRAGEAGGVLDDVLERLASLLERDADVRKKLRAALAYPAAVTTAAGALMIFLLARIVPMFAQMFAAFHAELPITTRILLAVGETLARPSVWIGAAVVAAAAAGALAAALRSARALLVLDRTRLAVPIVGALVRRAITARIARTLATLLRSGMDLVAAVAVVRPVAGSAAFAQALSSAAVAIREGDPFATALGESALFDPLLIALVGVGEETGQLDEMLVRVAAHFESDVESALATLGATLEPALIGVLGIAVGFIVFSVFLPLYQLIGSVSS
jgi:type IV pilus assembly protein PilC